MENQELRTKLLQIAKEQGLTNSIDVIKYVDEHPEVGISATDVDEYIKASSVPFEFK